MTNVVIIAKQKTEGFLRLQKDFTSLEKNEYNDQKSPTLASLIFDGFPIVTRSGASSEESNICRHRQPSSFSETEVVTDSENVSESNTDGFSDGNSDLPPTDFDILRMRDSSSQQRLLMNKNNGATEKIATVCNEIKQRFQPDLTNTDDENVI